MSTSLMNMSVCLYSNVELCKFSLIRIQDMQICQLKALETKNLNKIKIIASGIVVAIGHLEYPKKISILYRVFCFLILKFIIF